MQTKTDIEKRIIFKETCLKASLDKKEQIELEQAIIKLKIEKIYE